MRGLRTLSVVAIVSLLAAAALSAPAGADRASDRAKLERARTLWRAQGVRDYRFRLSVSCFCPGRGQPMTVTVRGGRVTGAKAFARTLGTFPRMFARIDSALRSSRSGVVKVSYDPRRGFARSASIDEIKLAIDDEIGWTVDRFRALK